MLMERCVSGELSLKHLHVHCGQGEWAGELTRDVADFDWEKIVVEKTGKLNKERHWPIKVIYTMAITESSTVSV